MKRLAFLLMLWSVPALAQSAAPELPPCIENNQIEQMRCQLEVDSAFISQLYKRLRNAEADSVIAHNSFVKLDKWVKDYFGKK